MSKQVRKPRLSQETVVSQFNHQAASSCQVYPITTSSNR